MADVIDYKIIGSDMQAVEIELDPNEGVRSEPGAMLYMESGIEMETSTGGGIFKGLARAIAGESLFITTFINKGNKKAKIYFAAPYPGSIIPIDLNSVGGEFLCQRNSYLCSAQGVDVEIAFTKRIGAGLFGGEGFILQRVKGDGLVFTHAGGTIIEKDLAAGEKIKVDTGCLVAFAPSVGYDIKLQKGVMNMLFGGEGLFLAEMTGPGKLYIQTLPFSRLADRITSTMSHFAKGQGINIGFGDNN